MVDRAFGATGVEIGLPRPGTLVVGEDAVIVGVLPGEHRCPRGTTLGRAEDEILEHPAIRKELSRLPKRLPIGGTHVIKDHQQHIGGLIPLAAGSRRHRRDTRRSRLLE